MRAVNLTVWGLVSSGAIYLALGLIGVFGTIDYAQLHVPIDVSWFRFVLLALANFANLFTFALSGIALALILTYISDLKGMPIRRWAEVRLVKDRLSLGRCLSLSLKISAAFLIVVGLVLHGTTVWDTPLALLDVSIITVGATARVSLSGLSAFVIAVLLEKVSAQSATRTGQPSMSYSAL